MVTLKVLFSMNPQETNNQTDGFPALMTEQEAIEFLRIPTVSKADDYKSVLVNLKRMRGLPCLHICRQPLYPREAVTRWIAQQTEKELAR